MQKIPRSEIITLEIFLQRTNSKVTYVKTRERVTSGHDDEQKLTRAFFFLNSVLHKKEIEPRKKILKTRKEKIVKKYIKFDKSTANVNTAN